MSDSGATPGERIAAFGDALQEEVVRPLGRYLKGFRAGLVLGLVAGLLLAPWPGTVVRRRLARGAAAVRRRRASRP